MAYDVFQATVMETLPLSSNPVFSNNEVLAGMRRGWLEPDATTDGKRLTIDNHTNIVFLDF